MAAESLRWPIAQDTRMCRSQATNSRRALHCMNLNKRLLVMHRGERRSLPSYDAAMSVEQGSTWKDRG